MRTADFEILDSAIRIPHSAIGRPLEPDTVSTVEGRNSFLMTVLSFDLGGAVFLCPTNFSLSLQLE